MDPELEGILPKCIASFMEDGKLREPNWKVISMLVRIELTLSAMTINNSMYYLI
jgi:hypothetical protein